MSPYPEVMYHLADFEANSYAIVESIHGENMSKACKGICGYSPGELQEACTEYPYISTVMESNPVGGGFFQGQVQRAFIITKLYFH
jgi:hypothetical protein